MTSRHRVCFRPAEAWRAAEVVRGCAPFDLRRASAWPEAPKICSVGLVAMLVAAGCGRRGPEDSSGADAPGGPAAKAAEADAGDVGGGTPATAASKESVPWPAKSIEKMRGSLATGAPRLKESDIEAVVKSMAELRAIEKKHEPGSPEAIAAAQKVMAAHGYENAEAFARTLTRVMAGYGFLGTLGGLEKSAASGDADNPMAAAMLDGVMSSMKANLKSADLTEADLRLIHKHFGELGRATAGNSD